MVHSITLPQWVYSLTSLFPHCQSQSHAVQGTLKSLTVLAPCVAAMPLMARSTSHTQLRDGCDDELHALSSQVHKLGPSLPCCLCIPISTQASGVLLCATVCRGHDVQRCH